MVQGVSVWVRGYSFGFFQAFLYGLGPFRFSVRGFYKNFDGVGTFSVVTKQSEVRVLNTLTQMALSRRLISMIMPRALKRILKPSTVYGLMSEAPNKSRHDLLSPSTQSIKS